MRLTTNLAVLAILLGLTSTSIFAQSTSRPASKPARQSSEMKHDQRSSSTKSARNVVHPDAKSIMPLEKGEKLPKVSSLKDQKNESVNLANVTAGKTSLIVFYRGGWCPYCNAHLGELAGIQPELEAAGVQILAITPDSPKTLAEFQKEKALPYTLLSDNNNDAAKAFGIAFGLDEKTQSALKGYGIDIHKASESPDAVLPVPSVFVVSPEGKVLFSHADANYKKRLSGEELLHAVGLKKDDSGS